MKKAFYLFLILISVNTLSAQPFSLDERIKPTELKLVDYKKDDSLRRGRINITKVVQVKDTAYYFVQGLSMYSPAVVGITAKAGSANIRINLCKNNWKNADKSGETGDSAHWEQRFKTEGDFGIMVIPEQKPAEYNLLVWAGGEAKEVGITSPFKGDNANAKKENTTGKSGGFMKNNLVYIIIGLLVVVIGILVFKLKNKKQ